MLTLPGRTVADSVKVTVLGVTGAGFNLVGVQEVEVPGVRLARVARTGRMLPQPMVESLDGTHLRLDDVLGSWFAVVGFECDPLATLTPTELELVDCLAVRPVKVIESCREITGKTLTFYKSTDRILVDGNQEIRTETKSGGACPQTAPPRPARP